MTSPFDVKKGIFYLNSETSFQGDMTMEDIEKEGVRFIEEIDMKTGWILKSMNAPFLNKEIAFDHYFYDKKLKKICFSLWEITDSYCAEKTFERQNAFLKKELGETEDMNEHHFAYHYPWGSITSAINFKNGTSSIFMTWEKR